MGEPQTWSYLIQATMLVGNQIKSWTLFGFECVCVFVKFVKNKSNDLKLTMFPLSPCDVIISGMQLISLDSLSLSRTLSLSLTRSLLLLLLSSFCILPLFTIITMETMFTGRAVWDPLRQKKRFIANTHPTVKQALSGYYEHTNTRFHTVSWDAFKWSTDYLR